MPAMPPRASAETRKIGKNLKKVPALAPAFHMKNKRVDIVKCLLLSLTIAFYLAESL